MELFLIALGALLSIMNPLGTVPVFVGLTQDLTPEQRNTIARYTALSILPILLAAFFGGKFILAFFGISIASLKIAGGLIIASSGFALLTGKFAEHKGMKRGRVKRDIATRDDIWLTPLAIPMIAGPGTISLLISYRQSYDNLGESLWILSAIVVASSVIFLVLRGSHHIVQRLGASGINALSRIIGFIVISIGVEFILTALGDVLHFG